MKRTFLVGLWGGLGLMAAVAGLGCSDPRAVEPTSRRLSRIHAVTEKVEAREQEGPQRLAKTGERIRETYHRSEAYFDRDLRYVADWAHRDVRRWNERQPLYRERIGDLLDGDLDHAHRTIPWLLY